MARNYVVIEVDGGSVANTTVVGDDEIVTVVLDFDNLEIDTEDARDALAEIDEIPLDEAGTIAGYKERLESIIEEAEAEDAEEEEDELDEEEEEEEEQDEEDDEDEG